MRKLTSRISCKPGCCKFSSLAQSNVDGNLTECPFITQRSSGSKKRHPPKYWLNLAHQREFFNKLLEHKDVTNGEVPMSYREVLESGGGSILRHYNSSLRTAIKTVLPSVNWRYKRVPAGYWLSITNHRRFLDSIADDIGIETQDQWYQVKLQDVNERGAHGLLVHYYHGSFMKALESLYPEYTWHYWLFDICPDGFWENAENRREYFVWLTRQLNITHAEQWYTVKGVDLKKRRGYGLINYYEGSMLKLLQDMMPEEEWLPWLFEPLSDNFWSSRNMQRQFLDSLAVKLHISTPQQWYEVRATDIAVHGGRGLLYQYGGDVLRLLQSVYPEHKWSATLAPQGMWRDIQNQRKFFDMLARELSIQRQEQWYQLRGLAVKWKKEELLLQYGGCFYTALMTIYSEYEWRPWLFHRLPPGYWKEEKYHRKFFDWLADSLGFESPQQLYSLQHSDLAGTSGGRLLQCYYENSIPKAVMTLYPEIEWYPWLFHTLPHDYWSSSEHVNSYIQWLSQQLHINTLDDWYAISQAQVARLGGGLLLKRYGGLRNLLQAVYPSMEWAPPKFLSKAQQLVKRTLKAMNIASPLDILVNYKHPSLRYHKSRFPMELDIYIPSLTLAFEYQGEQHYHSAVYWQKQDQQDLDQEKREACKTAGITLIEIPYWWDQQADSLLATLHLYRPDIVRSPGRATPIPASPPVETIKETEQQESTAMLPLPIFNTTASVFHDCWVSAGGSLSYWFLWNGQQLVFESGVTLQPPSFIAKQLPSVPVQGALYYSYG